MKDPPKPPLPWIYPVREEMPSPERGFLERCRPWEAHQKTTVVKPQNLMRNSLLYQNANQSTPSALQAQSNTTANANV